MKQNLKHLIPILIAITSPLFLYQNCNRINVTDEKTSQAVLHSNNNGGSYEGKIIDDYYRFVPNFSCQQNAAPLSTISITNTDATLTFNQNLQCASSVLPINLQLIDTSIFQTEFIGYLDGIYQFMPQVPSVVPEKIIEFWCRDRPDELGIETVTIYDSGSQSSVTKIYYATQNGSGSFTKKIISDFPVSSSALSPTKQVITNGLGFEIFVYRDFPSPTLTGLYKGRIESVIEGQHTLRDVWCRLGGRFDSGK